MGLITSLFDCGHTLLRQTSTDKKPIHISKKRTTTKEGNRLPRWLRNQLMRAFHSKDRREIRFLNQCWFTYTKQEQKKDPSSTEEKTSP